MAAVHRAHQGEGQVQDVTVQQPALPLQQHGQQLGTTTTTPNTLIIAHTLGYVVTGADVVFAQLPGSPLSVPLYRMVVPGEAECTVRMA